MGGEGGYDFQSGLSDGGDWALEDSWPYGVVSLRWVENPGGFQYPVGQVGGEVALWSLFVPARLRGSGDVQPLWHFHFRPCNLVCCSIGAEAQCLLLRCAGGDVQPLWCFHFCPCNFVCWSIGAGAQCLILHCAGGKIGREVFYYILGCFHTRSIREGGINDNHLDSRLGDFAPNTCKS